MTILKCTKYTDKMIDVVLNINCDKHVMLKTINRKSLILMNNYVKLFIIAQLRFTV